SSATSAIIEPAVTIAAAAKKAASALAATSEGTYTGDPCAGHAPSSCRQGGRSTKALKPATPSRKVGFLSSRRATSVQTGSPATTPSAVPTASCRISSLVTRQK